MKTVKLQKLKNPFAWTSSALGGGAWCEPLEVQARAFTGGTAAPFSLALLIVIVLSWVVFYIAASKFEERWSVVWRLFTTAGTILAVVTILGVYFFVHIAPRVQSPDFQAATPADSGSEQSVITNYANICL